MNPKYNEYMKPILDFLADQKIHKKIEIFEKMITEMNLSEEDIKEILPSQLDFTYKNRISWALTYLKKALLIESPARATFKITLRGLEFKNKNKPILSRNDLLVFPEFRDFQNRDLDNDKRYDETPVDNNDNESPEDQINKYYSELKDFLITEIIQEVLKMSPRFFEKLVLDLLEKMGYGKAFGTTYTNDQGIDGIINSDKLGLDKIYVQAKRYNHENSIGSEMLNSFVGAIQGKRGKKGIFITTSRFSKPAAAYADSIDALVLIDGRKLGELMLEYNVGVQDVSTFTIKKIDLDYFDE